MVCMKATRRAIIVDVVAAAMFWMTVLEFSQFWDRCLDVISLLISSMVSGSAIVSFGFRFFLWRE